MFEGIKTKARQIGARLDDRLGSVTPDNGKLHNLDEAGRQRALHWHNYALASAALRDQMEAFSPEGTRGVLTASEQMGYPDA